MKKITDYAELVKAKHALNKTIAPVEDGANIAGSYTSGKQFIREGVLYTALTTIAANTAWSSLTLDTDYELADDLTSQLASLNQTLTQKAYQTDDATETVLASDDLVPFYDTSATAKKKMSVANLIGQTVSNPNLLDNPWFTVNQREQSSYSSGDGGLTFDRWKLWGGSNISATVAKSNDVITITKGSGSGYAQIGEKLEDYSLLEGKTLTMSVLLADGTIKSGTAQFVDASTNFVFLIESGDFGLSFTAGYFSMVVYGASKQIKAFKLELGSVSTLAQDTAPNYATELLKCQRYFQVIAQGQRYRLAQYGGGGMINIPLTVPMRDKPTMSNTTFYLRSMDLQTESVASSQTVNTEHNYSELLIVLGLSTWNQDGQAYLKDGDLHLSADL